MTCKNVSAASSASDPAQAVDDLVAAITAAIGPEPVDLALILGSGWGGAAGLGSELADFSYADWPCFPAPPVAGHAGRLMFRQIGIWRVAVFSGRFHCYQNLSAFTAAFPVRLAASLGCRRLLLTCATGGINPTYRPGDFMYLADHLNLLGDNPLKGVQQAPFVDLTRLYRQDLFSPLAAAAAASGFNLHRGVLAAMPGPCYETPAEIRMLAQMGADVVSMSMVHEAIMARYLELEVAGLALVANAAAGLSGAVIDHADVLACGASSAPSCRALVAQLLALWQTS